MTSHPLPLGDAKRSERGQGEGEIFAKRNLKEADVQDAANTAASNAAQDAETNIQFS